MRWTMILAFLAVGCGDKEEDTGEDTHEGHEGHDTGEETGDDSGEETGEDSGEDSGEDAPDGAALFQSRCASCHGSDGGGIGPAPNLENELGHHSDEEIVAIILNGEGTMPPIDVTEAEAQAIVDHLHELFGD